MSISILLPQVRLHLEVIMREQNWHGRSRTAKNPLHNDRIQFTICLIFAGETPASPAKSRMIQTFSKHVCYKEQRTERNCSAIVKSL